MKNSMALLACACAMMLSSSAAHAGCFADWNGFSDDVGCLMLGTTFWPTLLGISSGVVGGNDDKVAYLGALQDEAADYVASDGKSAAGAVLQEALDQLRAKDASGIAGASDLDVAKYLLKYGD